MFTRELVGLLCCVGALGCSDGDAPATVDAGVISDVDAGGGGVDAGGGSDAAVPGPVTLSDEPGTDSAVDAVLATSPSGTMLAGWLVTLPSMHFEGRFRTSTDGGASWSDIRRVAPAVREDIVDMFAFTDASGAFMLLWQEWTRVAGVVEVVEMRIASVNADGTLSPSRQLFERTRPLICDMPSAVSLADGTIVAGATMYDAGFHGTFEARSAADGATPTILTTAVPADSTLLGHVCGSGSRVGVAFAEYDAGLTITRVTMRLSTDSGATWPAALTVAVSEPGETPSGWIADCEMDGDDAWVVYGLSPTAGRVSNTMTSHTTSLRVAHVTSAGVVDRRADVAGPADGAQFMLPQLAVGPGGAVDVVFYSGVDVVDPAGMLRARSSTDGARTFGELRTLASGIAITRRRLGDGWIGDYFGAVRRADGLFAAFVANEGGTSHVQFVHAP